MKSLIHRITTILPVAAAWCVISTGHAEQTPPPIEDPGLPREFTVSLDRVLTCLDPETAGVQRQVEVNLDPPKILYSNKPQRPTTQPQPQRPTTQPQRASTQRPNTQPASRESLDSLSRSRERGTTQTQRTQSSQRSAPSGGSRSGGGGGGRR